MSFSSLRSINDMSSWTDVLVGIEEAIELARAGKMMILVDDEDRENEGDIILPAEFTTPASVNFMATHARGLICLALAQERASQLRLTPMSRSSNAKHDTAFTYSIEARDGVTTGISAADRARTITVAVDPEFDHSAIVTPGHVFPLVAREGGSLVRAGHTEASVDLSRLAALNPSSVICEIMNDDGTMARLPQLIEFARRHGLKIATIADLIAYRRRTEILVERVVETSISRSVDGDWRMIAYRDKIRGVEHLAIVKGNVADGEPVMVRMHSPDLVGELVLSRHTPIFRGAMRAIAEQGRGAIVVLGDVHASALSHRIAGIGGDTIISDPSLGSLKDYGIGAQILKDLGISKMILLTNRSHRVVGLEGYDLDIVEEVRVPDI